MKLINQQSKFIFMQNNQTHTGTNETFQTNKGLLTGSELQNNLNYSCYEYNRSHEGMSHESLVRIGLGNDDFKQFYEAYKNNEA